MSSLDDFIGKCDKEEEEEEEAKKGCVYTEKYSVNIDLEAQNETNAEEFLRRLTGELQKKGITVIGSSILTQMNSQP